MNVITEQKKKWTKITPMSTMIVILFEWAKYFYIKVASVLI